MRAIVVGAGIGGLTAGLFLRRAGLDVRVFEAARKIKELGVGINVLPHATKELDRLGLLDALVAAGVLTREVVRFDSRGTLMGAEPRGKFAGYNWPQVSIHRGRFQRILYDAARAALGADNILSGHRLVGFEARDDEVRVHFADPAGAALAPETADILVAADGIHSRARRILYPDEGQPAYSGIMMWRGVSRAKPFLTGSSMIAVGDAAQKFVSYPVTAPDADGRALINWICELPRPDMLAPEDWNRPGRIEDFYPAFTGWAFDWCDVPAIVRAADGVFEFPMVDRDPLLRWSFGRVTLLGDAAHPMYPVGSNGASQAILDASALAEALVAHANPVEALKAYETARLAATARTVHAHRERQWEQPATGRDLEAANERFKKTVGFDVETVNRT
jgi:2-polyprenyl-6-methoxyphenol hydroxylase-like FAD-dependent oxidoreductase